MFIILKMAYKKRFRKRTRRFRRKMRRRIPRSIIPKYDGLYKAKIHVRAPIPAQTLAQATILVSWAYFGTTTGDTWYLNDQPEFVQLLARSTTVPAFSHYKVVGLKIKVHPYGDTQLQQGSTDIPNNSRMLFNTDTQICSVVDDTTVSPAITAPQMAQAIDYKSYDSGHNNIKRYYKIGKYYRKQNTDWTTPAVAV